MTEPSDLVRAYHREEREVSDDDLDAALGLPSQRLAAQVADDDVHAAHPGESVVNLATPFPVCRTLFTQVPLGADDVFLDLGCACGRVVLYGAAVTPARFVGIELVAERAELARAAAASRPRVHIVTGNALDHDLRAVTVVYAHRPFSVETERRMVARLHEAAARRPLTVVAHRLLPTLFDRRLFTQHLLGSLVVYRAAGSHVERTPSH